MIIILIAALLYVVGEVLYKKTGMINEFSFSKLLNLPFLVAFYTSLPIIFVFIILFISRLIMGTILAKYPLGYSSSLFLALITMLSFFIGVIVFSEEINFLRVIGFILLSCGILLIERNNYLMDKNT
jgi:multidrug transporter EmrE-like cation transporter